MKNYNPPICTGGCPAPYPFPVSSMLGGGLSRSQERLLSVSSHPSSSAPSSSQSESPLQTSDLLMHWPDHEKSTHTKIKEGRKGTPRGIKSSARSPQHALAFQCEFNIHVPEGLVIMLVLILQHTELTLTLARHKTKNKA